MMLWKQLKLLVLAAAFMSMASLVFFWGNGAGAPVATGAPATTVGIDVVTTGNTATALGATDQCVSVSQGGQLDVDVFLNEVPAGRDLGGFQYQISFDDTRSSMALQNHSLLLASSAGSSIADLGDIAPDTVSPHTVVVVDFGTAEVGPAQGVLGRYTMQVPPGAPSGLFALTLSSVLAVDSSSVEIPVDQVLDGTSPIPHGQIAVGIACPSPGQADLSIVKTDSSDPVEPSSTLTYTLSVSNAGPSAAVAAVITDTLPAGVTFSSSTPPVCSQAAGILTCPIGDLPSGSNSTVLVTTTVNPATSGSITNTASVISNTLDPNTGDNSSSQSTQVGIFADLVITKTDSPDPATGGAPLTYTLMAHNNGPSTATNVVATDSLPAAVTFVSASSLSGICGHSAGVVTCNLGSLASGGTATVTIVTDVSIGAAGAITNTASVSSLTADPTSANNSTSEGTFVRSGQLLTVVGIDTIPDQSPANGATSLGSVETCRAVSAGQQFDVDVFVDEVPAGAALGGFNYRLNYTSGTVTVVSQLHGDPFVNLLASAGGSSIVDFSDAVPDSDTPHAVAVADLGTDEVGPVAGVLGRYTINIAGGTPAGLYPISLSDAVLSDPAGDPIFIDQTHAALISVGQPCPPDSDADGVPDPVDNCPAVPNPDQINSDGDAAGDACDTDDDNDGVPDSIDNCRTASNPFQDDADADGIGDACDDTDGDGVADATDNCIVVRNTDQLDTDADGMGNACDSDDDNDTVIDALDNCMLAPNASQSDVDSDGKGDACDDDDGDGILDITDNCPNAFNPSQTDTDGDGQGDTCDPDDDNDTILDGTDNCPVTANSGQMDTDLDGLGDACDPDDDNDAVLDGADNCLVVPNPGQADNDLDGLGDACDNDDDNDTVLDSVDNCQLAANLNQLDSDSNGIGDACQDTDGDGVLDNYLGVSDNCLLIPNPSQSDVDGDGIGDACDPDDDNDTVLDGTDNCPLSVNSTQADNDADGIPGVQPGPADSFGGDACDPDDDNDGLLDSAETATDPLNPDTDSDTISDGPNDPDGAGPILAGPDNCALTPNTGQLDTDSDSLGDACDPDDDNDGVVDGSDNCPAIANAAQTDTDGDGLGDACDADDDNDGLLDGQETATDPLNPDTDGDTISDGPNDPDGAGAILAGSDNCALTPNTSQVNTDGDAFGDACDADDDNDGLLDGQETATDPLNPDTDGDTISDGPNDPDGGGAILAGPDNCALTPNTNQVNTDGDAFGDACDADDDNDGVLDGADNCATVVNPAQTNTDGDALGDACDPDDDNDTVVDSVDNCTLVPNPGQGDFDADGAGDACDDYDGDGIVDATDNCRIAPNPSQANNDLDGLGDVCDPDDDNDTVIDVLDNCPMVANTNQLNTDGDALGNACDPDDDNDGILDSVDACALVAEDFDGVTDTDGCPDTNAAITLLTNSNLTVDVGATNSPTVNSTATNGNYPANLRVTLTLVSALSACEARWNAQAGDSVINVNLDTNADTINDTLISTLERTETGVASGASRAMARTYALICFQSAPHAVTLSGSVTPLTPVIEESPANNQATNAITVTAFHISDVGIDSWTAPDDLAPGAAVGTAEAGVQCANNFDDDGDTVINDGCPDIPGNQVLVQAGAPPHVKYPSGVPGAPRNFTLSELLTNNGPFGPVALSVSETVADIDGDGDTVIDCDLQPNSVTPVFLAVASGSSVNDIQPSTATWLDAPAPPYSCLATYQKTIQITTPYVSDPNLADNTASLVIDFVRDADGDGVPDNYAGIVDNCPTVPNPDQVSTMTPGIGDACDPDFDFDGVDDNIDNCVDLYNPSQANSDADSLGNACDPDDDNDGICDIGGPLPHGTPGTPNGGCAPGATSLEPGGVDNCSLVPNAGQQDFDNDGRGDACDWDTDNDKYANSRETAAGSNPFDAASTPEVCDGLDNDKDTFIDESYDLNGDSLPDCSQNIDSDGDTIPNTTDTDDDNDGYSDSVENYMGTNSLVRCPRNSSDDAFPPDIDRNRVVNVIDVLKFKGLIPSLSSSPDYDRRLDLDGSGVINVLDILKLKPLMLTVCA